MVNKRLKVYYIGQHDGLDMSQTESALDKAEADLFLLDHMDDESELILSLIHISEPTRPY